MPIEAVGVGEASQRVRTPAGCGGAAEAVRKRATASARHRNACTGHPPREAEAVNVIVEGFTDDMSVETLGRLSVVAELGAVNGRARIQLDPRNHAGQPGCLCPSAGTGLSTVQKWEIGQKKPTDTALKLLHLMQKRGSEVVA